MRAGACLLLSIILKSQRLTIMLPGRTPLTTAASLTVGIKWQKKAKGLY
jgi:hypothetical protein